MFCCIVTPRKRGAFMLIKNNVAIGIEWRFGANWPGERCGAKTRNGTPCQRPANKKNGRCRLHGGASSGPRTESGRARISAATLGHGNHTKDKLEITKKLNQVLEKLINENPNQWIWTHNRWK